MVADIGTAYALFVENYGEIKRGTVGINQKTSQANYFPGILDFMPETSSFNLIVLQVSNYQFDMGGIWKSICMGKKHVLHRLK